MNYQGHVQTSQSIIVMFDSDVKLIESSNPLFNKLKDALTKKQTKNISELVDMAGRIKHSTGGKFYSIDGIVYIDEQQLPESLSNRLIQFIEKDLDCDPLIKFWEN